MLVRSGRRVRRGVGDWFSPSCAPGSPGCVPHWYCYIPGMATSDCWASFVQGTSEIGQATGTAASAPVTAAVGGFVKGLFNPGALDQGCDPSAFWCNYGSIVLIAAAVGIGFVLLQPSGRRRR